MLLSDMYKVRVPEGECGAWKIKRFTVDKVTADKNRMYSMISFNSFGRSVPEGVYTLLTCNGEVVMSDTPDEIRDHYPPIMEVQSAVQRGEKPTCLVHGLGLGMVVCAMLDEGAASVTIIEQAPEVIELVGSHLIGRYGQERVIIREDDALTWTPPRNSRWDVVWHDIWESLCEDNLPEMKVLHRRFGRRSKWQGSWGRERIRRWAR